MKFCIHLLPLHIFRGEELMCNIMTMACPCDMLQEADPFAQLWPCSMPAGVLLLSLLVLLHHTGYWDIKLSIKACISFCISVFIE